VDFEAAPYETARWVHAADPAELKRFEVACDASLADDRDGAPVFMARNDWELRYTQKQWPNVTFAATRERVAAGRED
jgi:peptide chain release factor 3